MKGKREREDKAKVVDKQKALKLHAFIVASYVIALIKYSHF